MRRRKIVPRDPEEIRAISRPDVETVIWRIRQSHPYMVPIFTSGGCFSFYLILASVFSQATSWYDGNHVLTLIDGEFYDIEGIFEGDVSKYRPLRDHHGYPDGKNRDLEEVGMDGKWGMSHRSWMLHDRDEKSREKLMKGLVTG